MTTGFVHRQWPWIDNYAASGPAHKQVENKDVSPITLLHSKDVNDVGTACVFRALLDSGGTRTMVHRQALP